MTENNIKNLDEDIAVSYGLNVSTTDIVAATSITIKSSPTTTLQSNLGLNNQNNSDEFITITNPKLSGVGKKTVTPKGVPATGGVLLKTQNTKNLPNIFFNFKEKTFTNYKDLLFKFETSNLVDADFIGTKLPTWFGNTDVSSISLTNASNPLSVVKAYGKYFYQLDRTTSLLDNSISNTVTLPIKTNPSYTIFVFGVGTQTVGQGNADRLSRVNVLHTFCDSNNPKANSKNYNIGQIQTLSQGQVGGSGNNQARYSSKPTASFVGNTLNSAKYTPQAYTKSAYDRFINIYDKNFSSILDENESYLTASYQNNFDEFIRNDPYGQNKYNPLCYSNVNKAIPYSPFVLNRKTTLNVDDNINLNYFSLHFVEMFSYIEGSISIVNDNYTILRLQTFINGFLTYDGRTFLKKNIPIESSGTFKIKLSNDYISSKNGGATYDDTKLFLFDYIHGISNSSVSTMKQTSRNIVESLLYDYRNIILKSTTDIQFSNSTSALPITSTSFPPTLIHPFLKMFFT